MGTGRTSKRAGLGRAAAVAWIAAAAIVSAAVTWVAVRRPVVPPPSPPAPTAAAARAPAPLPGPDADAATRPAIPVAPIRPIPPPDQPPPGALDPARLPPSERSSEDEPPIDPATDLPGRLPGGLGSRIPPEILQLFGDLPPRERAAVGRLLEDAQRLDRSVTDLRARNAALRDRMEESGLVPPPTPEELAERGELRFRIKDLAGGDAPLSLPMLEQLGLSSTEAASVQDLYHDSFGTLQQDVQGLLAELTGDPAAGRDYTLNALIEAIRDRTPPADFEAAVRQVAQELAGEVGAPDEPGSAAERMLRAIYASRDELRDALRELLGPETAEALLSHPDMAGVDTTYDIGD